MNAPAIINATQRVSEIMSLGAATLRPEETLLLAAELLVDHRISALPVENDAGKICGILSEADFFRATGVAAAQLLQLPAAERRAALARHKVGEAMTPDPVTIAGECSVTEAIELMERRGLKRLPVVVDDRPAGMLSRADLIRALTGRD